jgi:hypothetical protein
MRISRFLFSVLALVRSRREFPRFHVSCVT